MSEGAGFEELARYVGVTADDAARLAVLQGPLDGQLEGILDGFYEVIRRHPAALAAFKDPEVQIPRQREKLSGWLRALLAGPHDAAHYERTERVGRAHVVHQLPQRYMHGGMNLLRKGLIRVAFDVHAGQPAELLATVESINRVLDIELGVMMRTYTDDVLTRMKRQERLAAVGELSAGIHHELKNPLASVQAATLALAERRSVRADRRGMELVRTLRADVDRVLEIVSDLLSFARMKDPERALVSPNDLVEAAVARVVVPPRCRLDLDLDPALPQVHVDERQILQVLINVLENAVEALPIGGRIRLVTRATGGHVSLTIEDEGVGIEPEDLSRIFEPLFSTKPDGIGLGLSLSLQLASANTVALTVTSSPGTGTTVRLDMPVAPSARL